MCPILIKRSTTLRDLLPFCCCREKLREKKEASGDPDYAVSADDVHSINHAFSHAEEDEEEED